MMVFERLLALLLIVFVVWQILVPAARGRLLFPLFRRRTKEDAMLQYAQRELENAQRAREAAEKEAAAIKLREEANRVSSEAVDEFLRKG